MTESIHDHFKDSDDCAFLCDHFSSLYYLLHKAAIRRLRIYQWDNRLNIEEARKILQNSISNYPLFHQIMCEMYDDPIMTDSYKKDRRITRQIMDRLYTKELLDITQSSLSKLTVKVLLSLLRLAVCMKKSLK